MPTTSDRPNSFRETPADAKKNLIRCLGIRRDIVSQQHKECQHDQPGYADGEGGRQGSRTSPRKTAYVMVKAERPGERHHQNA
jgi:hypothetical protein